MENKYIMTESGTTSIDQLPINPQISSNNSSSIQMTNSGLSNNISSNNISSTILSNNNETQNIKIENYGQQLNAERSNDSMIKQTDYASQLQSALKEASVSGTTTLPSRDIPQSTLMMQQDEETKVNFVPNKSNDYIGDILDKERIIKENQKNQNKSDNLDYLYEQLQMPLLVSIIYFLFQLPAVRTQIFSFIPSLFNKDGNPNLYGYIFNSIMFGGLYFALIKCIKL